MFTPVGRTYPPHDVNTQPFPSIVVRVPVGAVYAAPAADADVVTDAVYGTPIRMHSRTDEWIEVQTPDACVGWMHHTAVCARENAQGEGDRSTDAHAGDHEERCWVTSLFAHVYETPRATPRAPCVTLPFESSVSLPAAPANAGPWWRQVRLVDGRLGWMQTSAIAVGRTPRSVSHLVSWALRFVGIPFTWGGTSTLGFDCSGFVQMLCRERGVMLPRRSHQHAAWSGVTPVVAGDLMPGDLLFFGRQDQGISHEGMFLGGDVFIHATNYGTPIVKVSRVSDERWRERLLIARRIVAVDEMCSLDQRMRIEAFLRALEDAGALLPVDAADAGASLPAASRVMSWGR